MKKNVLVQSAIILGSLVVIILFVVRDRVQDWMSPPKFDAVPPGAKAAEEWIVRCPMDGYEISAPGMCGICKMPLTDEHRVRKGAGAQDLSLGNDMIRTLGLQTQPVQERELVKVIHAAGRITHDERLMRDITARVEARIEKLHKNFVGQKVQIGEPLADIYSPDLVATQEELLVAIRSGNDRNAASARTRLQLWGITDAQVEEIEKGGKAQRVVTLMSPAGGYIITLPAHQGHTLKEGEHYMEVVDLSSVWLYAEIYEYEIPFVQAGQRVEILSPAFSGATFVGTVSYLNPFLDEKSRTQKVRIDIANPDGRLLPGMFTDALIRVPLGPGGAPVTPTGEVQVDEYFCHAHGVQPGPGKCPKCDTVLDTRTVVKPVLVERTVWVCGPCCPEVRMDKGGQCPECPMLLTAKKETGIPRALAVPREAVLDTGMKRFVFVETAPETYRKTEVGLGPMAGGWYPVRKGLVAGQKVVTRAAFLLDSQTQITTGGSALYSGATETGK